MWYARALPAYGLLLVVFSLACGGAAVETEVAVAPTPAAFVPDGVGDPIPKQEGTRYGWAGREGGWWVAPVYDRIQPRQSGYVVAYQRDVGYDLIDLGVRPPTVRRLPCDAHYEKEVFVTQSGVVGCRVGREGRLVDAQGQVITEVPSSPLLIGEDTIGTKVPPGAEATATWWNAGGQSQPGPAPWLSCHVGAAPPSKGAAVTRACLGSARVGGRQAPPGTDPPLGLWRDGRWVVPNVFKSFVLVSPALVAFTSDEAAWTMYNDSGKQVGPTISFTRLPSEFVGYSRHRYHDGLLPVIIDGACGWLDERGTAAAGFKPGMTWCSTVDQGHAWVVEDGKGAWKPIR